MTVGYGVLNPRRIQMSRQKPWRADNPDAVVVARPSKWGNPFGVGSIIDGLVLDRDRAVGFYTNWLTNSLDENGRYVFGDTDYHGVEASGRPSVEEIRAALRGRDLACWCPLDQPCHADVLLRIANRPDPTADEWRESAERWHADYLEVKEAYDALKETNGQASTAGHASTDGTPPATRMADRPMVKQNIDPKAALAVLREVESIVSDCSPQGQYERFNDRLLYVRLRELKASYKERASR